MNDNEKRVPKRRFKEFENAEAWEQRKLGDITSYIKGFAFKSVDYKADGIRIIRVSDLSKDCVSEDVDKIYIDKNKAKQYITYTINNGDIVITTVGSKAELKESAVGRPIIFTENKGYLLNQNLVKIAPITNYDSQFIYNQLLRERYTKYIADIQRGNANQANITISDLWEYSFHCPAFAEQNKIGEVFNKLDNTITLHQRKLEKMKALKKAYLTDMFPAEGERKPKLRFAGFIDDWEQRKFDEEVEFYNGLTYSPNDVSDNGTFVLRSSNVKNGEIVDADNVYVNSEVVNSSNVKEGDIIVVVRNGSRSLIGKHAQIKKKMDKTVIGAFMTGIRSNQSSFINALMDTQQFSGEIEKNLGATINQITNGMFREMRFMFPDIQEQNQIGKFFIDLDNLIILQQRKLEKLQNIKKAYLNEMFV